MIGLLILCVVLLLLWFFPLGISAAYNAEGLKAYWLLGPIKLKLYPGKKKDSSAPVSKKRRLDDNGQKDKGGSYEEFIPILRMIVDFLRDFRNKLRVNYLQMKLIMAGDDPCDLAIHYGEAWAAVAHLYPLLESVFYIKRRQVEVECDFTAQKTLLFLRADITITLGRALLLGKSHGFKFLKEYFRHVKLRKGGMNHEPKSS